MPDRALQVAPEFQPEVDGDGHGVVVDERCTDDGCFLEFLHRPTNMRNFMSRVDWCALRGVAGCEYAILPIMAIAAS